MVLLGLGANLPGAYGPPEKAIEAAYAALAARGVEVMRTSSVWRSAPVPASRQPWYCNAVAQVETSLAPHDLLGVLKEIEGVFGRRSTQKNAPRPLDLDILAYGRGVVAEVRGRKRAQSTLQIPHPRMHERAFVLYPLQEILPGWVHPVLGLSVTEMIKKLPPGQMIDRLDRAA